MHCLVKMTELRRTEALTMPRNPRLVDLSCWIVRICMASIRSVVAELLHSTRVPVQFDEAQYGSCTRGSSSDVQEHFVRD